jgi:hypothetical protein
VSQTPPVEVIGQGREPDAAGRPARRLSRPARATLYAVVAALAAVGVWVTARPTPASPSAASPATTQVPQTRTEYPTPSASPALPIDHDLTVSASADQRSFIAFSGHILLFLHLTYAGPKPVRVVDGRVPQEGAYPDAGAGGLTAGTTDNGSLRAGVPTEVFVRTRVDCPAVLAGSPTDHVDLVTQASGAAPRAQVVSLAALGAYWDEARHAACTRPDASTALSIDSGVYALTGVRAQDSARPEINGVLALHNADGFEAVAVPGPTGPGLQLTAPPAGTVGADIDGGSTDVLVLRWVVTDCALALRSGPPALSFDVTVADSHSRVSWASNLAFGPAWPDALAAACR